MGKKLKFISKEFSLSKLNRKNIKNLKNLKIMQKIFVIAIISISSLIILGLVSLVFLGLINHANKTTTENSLPAIITAEEINSLVMDYRNQEYNHVMNINISEKEEIGENIQSKKDKINQVLVKYEGLVLGKEDGKLYDSIKPMWNQYLESSAECLKASTDGNQSKAIRVMKKNQEEYSKMRTMLGKLVTYNKDRVNASKAFVSNMNHIAIIFVITAIILIILISLKFTLVIAKSIVNPIKEIDHAAKEIANENLDVMISYESEDELGVLAKNFNKTVIRLGNYVHYIDEISYVLNDISKGNLNFQLHNDYTGEFSKVKEALLEISESLNKAFRQINLSSELVACSAGQLSQGSNVLADGVAKQANTLDTLISEIEAISSDIQKNAKNANEANIIVSNTSEEVKKSNETMQDMISAMEEIGEKSSQISEIVLTIEGIASQTNLLSLNASIEAARAGEAGRGFAVVADEVKGLANQCKYATQKTAELINETMMAVKSGREIADNTAKSLENVVENIFKSAYTMSDIAKASEDQAELIKQIEEYVEGIYSVVQSNSATSEESAAASCDLNNQAQMLKELVFKFQLKEI